MSCRDTLTRHPVAACHSLCICALPHSIHAEQACGVQMVIQEARDCLDSLWGEPWPRWRAPQALAAAEERTDNASLLLHCALYLDVLGSRKDQIIPMIRFISAADPPSLLSR